MKNQWNAIAYRIVVAAVLVSLLAFGIPGHVSATSIIYVKPVATGWHNGTSWAHAYGDLQSALGRAISGDQIWVAKGTYVPTATADRTLSFELKDGVAIYGGFAATETSLSQRNWKTNVTTLSGDIGVMGDASDNSYHVVTAGGVANTSILDGFTITGGNANGAMPTCWGGGMYNINASPTLRNLIFSNNLASATGGAVYNRESRPIFKNVTFLNNSAAAGGGAIYNYSSSPALDTVEFIANSVGSGASGGAMSSNMGGPTLTNVMFSGNSAPGGRGGAIYNSFAELTLANVTFRGNWAARCGAMDAGSIGRLLLTNSTFSGNKASERGGALCLGGSFANMSSSARLANVTFSGNSAASGGGMFVGPQTGGSDLVNVTFNANSAASGGAIYSDYNSQLRIYNSIFWGDGTKEFAVDVAIATLNIANSIVQGGCPAGIAVTCTHVVNANPILSPLQNNGGFTQTMALGLGTSAIDISTTNCPASDQRGVLRPQGPGCDAGAYEARAVAFRSQPAYDGHIIESGKATNKGAAVTSQLPTLLVGDDANDRRYRGFLSFDTSSLQGKTPIFALLRLRRQSMLGQPFGTQGSLIADLSAPYFGTQLALLSSDFQTQPLVLAASRPLVAIGSGWYKSLLRPAAVFRINRYGTTQFRLWFTTDNYNAAPDYLAFCSGEANTPACLPPYRPILWVYYTP